MVGSPDLSSGVGPSCRHAHRSVDWIPSHQPGRSKTSRGFRWVSSSAAWNSASIDSS